MRPRHIVLTSIVIATWACSSNNGDDSSFVDGGGDGSGGDATQSSDSGNKKETGPGFDSSPGDDGSTSADSATDASFDFDGFSKGDGSACLDDDGDGWTTCAGDCNDHDSLVNPCAFDTNAASGDAVGSDGIDNDCDGTIDNLRTCDGSLSAGHDTTAGHYASAMDICDNPKCTFVNG